MKFKINNIGDVIYPKGRYIEEKILKGGSNIKGRFHKSMKSYYNTDKKLALEIETTNSEIIKNCNNFLENASKSWSISLRKSPKEANVISKNMLSAARVIEYVKASSIFTKHIARKVLSIDQ